MTDPISDQRYYWSSEWQADEQQAVAEIARGEGRGFEDTAEAVRWLTERPGVEFHRSTFVVVIGAVLIGLAFIVGVVWYEMAGGR